MYISLKWIKMYVDIDINDAKMIGSDFTLKVAEIEDLIFQKDLYKNIVVGKILEINKIENMDKLYKCVVYDGENKLQIITGATNIKINDFVPLAKIGSIIPSNGKKIEKVNFKGIESHGMLCSPSELKYYNDESGILILQDINKIFNDNIIDISKIKEGVNIADLLELDDVIIEIDNKSLTNRPDLWGHYGIAREIASIYGLNLKPYSKEIIKLKNENKINIEIEDKDACPAYAVIHISNIKNCQSPIWLQKFLYSIGQRPISLIVDLTNFVMFDIGEPMHAFDTEKVNHTNTIKIRFPKNEKEKKVKTLDGKEREITDKTLLILDSNDNPIAIAGIMGLENSEVNENTNSILLEIANFNQAIIRKASVNLKLRTEASQRFEKSLDPNFIELAYNKFIQILSDLQKNIKIESVNYKKYYEDKKIKIELSYDFIKNKLGKNIPETIIKNILINLGFEIIEYNNNLEVYVPSYRATKDISIKEDIVEEVGRIFGYINIEPNAPKVKLDMPHKMEEPDIVKKIKLFLCYNEGLTEVNNYPFSSIEIEKIFNDKKPVEIENPLDEKLPILKMSLIPGLINNAILNLKYFDEFGIFEVEKIYYLNDSNKTEEILEIAGLICKNDQVESVYYARNALINLFNHFNIFDLKIKNESIPSYLHPFKSGTICHNNEIIGYFGEIHPEIISKFELKKPISIFLTNFNNIVKYKKDFIPFKKIPKIQSTKFDLAFIVDKNTYSNEIVEIIKDFSNENYYIAEVTPFDVYYSKQLGEDKKSIAFSITVQPYEKSLTSEDTNELINKIVNSLKSKGFELRK
ncbi:MAG: phenylalanine--tRNA ligase subunit beta [Spirochaetes bacterium]|nr:phenylalanine--tRNA ligase subunit beta [Spirochaetota bacterium]